MTMQTKRELAHDILNGLFSHRNRITIAEAVAAAAEIDVSRRTLERAAKELGVREIHNGPYGAFWERGKWSFPVEADALAGQD